MPTDIAAKAALERSWSLRRTLQKLHLWVALALCLPFLMLAVTGSILVFHHELLELESPAFYRASSGTPRPPAEIAAAAVESAGPGHQMQAMFLPDEPGAPAIVRLAMRQRGGQAGGAQPTGPGAGTQVFLDPATLAVLGKRGPGDAPGLVMLIRQLHANLLMPGRDGRVIVGWLGVAMLFLGLTGPILWWPRPGQWRAAFTVKRGACGRRLHRDLHGAFGIWTIALFLVVCFSGVYLSFPQLLGAAITGVLTGRDLRFSSQAMRVEPARGGEPLALDAAIAIAQEAAPDGSLRSIFPPGRPDQPYRIHLAPPGHDRGAPMITAFIDPWKRKLIELRDPRGYSWGETVTSWQHALHAGEGLGWSWKLLVFMSGPLSVLFIATGIAMWWLKRRARLARRAGAAPA